MRFFHTILFRFYLLVRQLLDFTATKTAFKGKKMRYYKGLTVGIVKQIEKELGRTTTSEDLKNWEIVKIN